MISKETFCKALRLIEEQREIDRQFSKALESLGNGYFVFGSNNRHLEAAVMVLKEAMRDEYEYVEWWLFDTGKEKTVRFKVKFVFFAGTFFKMIAARTWLKHLIC